MMNRLPDDSRSQTFCPDRQGELIDYIFDEMGPGAAEAFESHLSSCVGCTREVASLEQTRVTIQDASTPLAETAESTNGGGLSWEEEWTLLRRRLLFADSFPARPVPAVTAGRTRWWLLNAAAIILAAGVAFSAGYLWRGPSEEQMASAERSGVDAAPPVSGASTGNYFDNLDDFTRDTHNFLRRTRMILMEFTNLGEDSDPTFFRNASAVLLREVEGYRSVAARMENRKLGDLLDQIAGILKAMSTVDIANQLRVVADVKATLDLTGLVATLEILHAAVERDLRGQPNV
jgi:hypothetical protein